MNSYSNNLLTQIKGLELHYFARISYIYASIFCPMTLQTLLGLILLGIIAGFSSSLVGIGGGIIIVPVLVFVFGFDQKMAQGTSLFLLAMPVALAGAITYYKAGNVDVKTALVLAVCFLIGGFLGGKLANKLDTFYVKKIFAIFMIIMAVKYLFFDKPSAPKATLKNETHQD